MIQDSILAKEKYLGKTPESRQPELNNLEKGCDRRARKLGVSIDLIQEKLGHQIAGDNQALHRDHPRRGKQHRGESLSLTSKTPAPPLAGGIHAT